MQVYKAFESQLRLPEKLGKNELLKIVTDTKRSKLYFKENRFESFQKQSYLQEDEIWQQRKISISYILTLFFAGQFGGYRFYLGYTWQGFD